MLRISLKSLRPGSKIGKAIFSEEGKLLLGRGVIINEYFIGGLQKRGVTSVFINDGDTGDVEPEDSISEMVRGSTISHLKDLLSPLEDIRNEMKGQSIEAVAATVTSKKFIESFGKSPAFQKLTGDAATIVDQLMSGEVTLGLSSIKTYDNYLFQHSIDVALVSIMMGRQIGFKDKRLRELGIGCLLHDIGKTLIPNEIVNKPDKLTPAEFEIMKKHSTIGYELIKGVAAIGMLPPHVALQHHERQDGTGYPRGLTGDNSLRLSMKSRTIHLYGHIAAVADVYDALSSDRPYRPALPPEEVFRIMRGMSGNHLNTTALNHFLKIAPLYPVGTTVRVVSRKYYHLLGVVVGYEAGDIANPIVRLVLGQRKERIEPIQFVLNEEKDVTITSIVL